MSAFTSAGFSNGVMYANNVNFSGSSPHTGDITADGQLLIGNAVFPFLRPGVLKSTNGSVTITYDDPDINLEAAGGLTWNEVAGTSQAIAVDNGYIANNGALVTLTLPATAALGTVVRVVGKGAGGWRVAQNAGQFVNVGGIPTTTGAGGSISSTDDFDAIELLCTVADTTWTMLSSVGVLTLV